MALAHNTLASSCVLIRHFVLNEVAKEPTALFGRLTINERKKRRSFYSFSDSDFQLNGTHVEYRNKLVAGSDGAILEKGAVIVGSQNSPSRKALAAKLKCLFPVELMVSTAFLPNISHVTIPACGFNTLSHSLISCRQSSKFRYLSVYAE